MYRTHDLLSEAQEALDKVWFVQSIIALEQTDTTLSVRLEITSTLFVHAYLGELSGSLYFALIENGQRIFGIDRDSGNWHAHPYESPHKHVIMSEGLEPKPLLRFLSRVEDLLLQSKLL